MHKCKYCDVEAPLVTGPIRGSYYCATHLPSTCSAIGWGMNAKPTIFSCKCQTGRVMEPVRMTADRFAEFEFLDTTRAHCGRCWTCGFRFKFVSVRGKVSPKHTCDARCEASKGPSCECSCGGKNHGASYEVR